MASRFNRHSYLRHASPLSIGVPRALLEATLGYALLLLLVLVIAQGHEFLNTFAVGLTALAWLWLSWWPAWRLRPVPGHTWYLRLAKGVSRALLIAVSVGLVGVLLDGFLHGSIRLINLFGAVPLGLLFVVGRVLVLLAAVILQRAQLRLRWQLMVSHVGVVVLTFVSLTAVGSIIGLALLVHGIRPHPTSMAQSIADEVRLANGASPSPGATTTVLKQVYAERLPLRGEPALIGFAPRELLPTPILVLTLDGRVVAARRDPRDPSHAQTGQSWSDVVHAYMAKSLQGTDRVIAERSYAAVWNKLRAAAIHGHTLALSAPYLGPDVTTGAVLAEAPVRGPDGKTVGLVALAVGQYSFTAPQFFAGALALFGVTTVALIIVTAVPVIGLSFLFSYVLARSLTRRLESVSQVATSIASGNLSQRAPVTSRNEVGQLAEDINKMAAHLDTTVSELQTARTQAEEALRTRQELVANISHELRTPLAILRAHLETLFLRNPVPAGSTARSDGTEIAVPVSTLQALQSETERLESLIDDLFALSRARSDALVVRREPVDIAALVDEIATLMRPLALADGKISLSVEAKPGLPYALGDPDRLRQILANLIRNAVRHTPEGGIIVLSVAAEDGWIVVSVADTGEGIPAEHLPHIFERFYRVDQARSRTSGGAGLGLAIVREFVELMDGHISVESAPGEGTCFHVFLPVTRSADTVPAPTA